MTTSNDPTASDGDLPPESRVHELSGGAARMLQLSRLVVDGVGDVRSDVTGTALALVCDLVPGASWASLTHRESRPHTTAASDEVADVVDEFQYRTGTGPCLSALDTDGVVVSDFATETRWPQFTELAMQGSPARGALSFPLSVAGHPGTSLNIYTGTGGGFDATALPAAGLAAAGLAMALTAVQMHRRSLNLQIGLQSSRQIGAAVGILMHRHRVTYEAAFELLTQASQRTQRKLREVAEEVVLTGSAPA